MNFKFKSKNEIQIQIPTISFIRNQRNLASLKNESIAFESVQEMMDKFEQLEQSNLCLIEKNLENQEKCFAITNRLKQTRQDKDTKLKKLKAKKALLKQQIESRTY